MKRDLRTYSDLPPGTRVRSVVRSVFGWKGTATMLANEDALIDGRSDWSGTIAACPWEWRIMRDQTPNPEHAEAVADFGQWAARR